MSSQIIRVPGKWVLCGEHTVLRGGVAIALPHPEFALELEYREVGGIFSIFPVEATPVVQGLIGQIREGWSARLEKDFPELQGELRLHSEIPVGSGLGSSAALCVGVLRFVLERAEIVLERDVLRAWATELENRFHGTSSGMDVAAVVEGVPIVFRRGMPPERITIDPMFQFSFHDTGRRARTADCITQVLNNPGWDDEMKLASEECLRALRSGSIDALALGMQRAQRCFEGWGLVPDDIREQAQALYDKGARAVKMTGAGAGGFLVALK